jgi:hypothetical protein
MAKLPALQFYPGDWKKDLGVQSLSLHNRGLWFEMLLLMHDSEQRGKLVLNGRAMTHSAIAQAIGLDNQIFQEGLTLLLEFGVASIEPDTGIIYCRRMVKDEKTRIAHTEAGKRGGNPILVNQKPTPRVNQTFNQKPTPSFSSSDTEINSDGPIDPSMAVSGLIQLTGIHTREARIVLDRLACQAEKEGLDLKVWVEMMAKTWHMFESSRAKLEYAWGAEKFFGEGHYKNSDGWPWKNGHTQTRKLKAVSE